MTFGLQPNPSLYAKLAAQWEAEESRRQDEAAARKYFSSQKNRFLILFVVVVCLVLLSLLVYKFLVRSRTRRVAQRIAYPEPDVFSLQRPTDDDEIEDLFIDYMCRHGWQHLHDADKRRVLDYTPDKKWSLIYQDRLTEWKEEQKRWQARRHLFVECGKDIEDVIIIEQPRDEKALMV